MSNGPLSGIRILDLTHVWAGPLGTRILADLGADVVKIEGPMSRGPKNPPPNPLGMHVGGERGEDPWNRTAILCKLSRNKRSIGINLKDPQGRDAFLQLVSAADVVIENFSARAMPSLNLGYEVLRQANPAIIYVTMPGYGTFGPYTGRVAFGPSVEPMSGLGAILGYSADEPHTTAMALPDAMAGVIGATAVVSALRRRQQSGEGARVELSLHESGVNFMGEFLADHQLGAHFAPAGNRHPVFVPQGIYPCAGDDAWLAISVTDDAAWTRLCQFLDPDNRAGVFDPAADMVSRKRNHDAIDQHIRNWSRTIHKQGAAVMLQERGIAAGAVNATPDMLDDPQLQARNYFVALGREDLPAVPMPGSPITISGVDHSDWKPLSKLGADNEDVLKTWLGYDDSQIHDLQSTGVLVTEPPR